LLCIKAPENVAKKIISIKKNYEEEVKILKQFVGFIQFGDDFFFWRLEEYMIGKQERGFRNQRLHII